MSDYDRLAEFHELFMADAWNALAPTFRAVFGALSADDTVLDLGAGSGLGVEVLARCTAARVIAVEPSTTMRAMLTAKVGASPDLTRRVTVLPGAAPGVVAELVAEPAWPAEGLGGFVCAHVLGHLDRADRAATLAGLAAALRPGAAGVVTLAASDDATPTAHAVESCVRLGELRYVERHVPAPPGRYCAEYEVWRHDRLLRSERFAGRWEHLGPDRVAAELHEAGLVAQVVAPGVGVVSPAPAGVR